jgi:hypothetical protein
MRQTYVSDKLFHSLCCYINKTRHLQVVRITNIPNWYYEGVVFPGQRLLFEAPADARLEVHTSHPVTALWTDTMSCDRLRVKQG